MKAPAVPVVAMFAAGIALANVSSLRPVVWLALTICLLLAALAFLRRESLLPAWLFGLAAWMFLGALAATLERSDLPQDDAARAITSGRLDSGTALRWRGRLRYDPVRLPGGIRYDLDLDSVQAGERNLAVSGGLRANLYENPRHAAPPEDVHAGDRVELLVHARIPRNYQDPGAFDARGYYERQQIDLLGTVRDAALVRKLESPPPEIRHRLARLRGRLLERLDSLLAQAPAEAAILRAMLLGDRNFLDQETAVDFQKTAVYHVLVLAGLHLAALTAFVYWLSRLLRLRLEWGVLLTLAVLAAFVAIVEDRPPILRAALMAAVLLAGRMLYRRIDPLNVIAVAAMAILVFKPSALTDPSFQLSFLAVGAIAGVGAPWIERTSETYVRALAHLGDTTRDPGHAPRPAQFRLDARTAAEWLSRHLPQRIASRAELAVTLPCGLLLRLWEICVISLVLNFGMLPLLTTYFHRVSLSGPVANVPAVLLTALIVPLGFLALGVSLVWQPLAAALAVPLRWLTTALMHTVTWFAGWPRWSYRIPEPPLWLAAAFLAALVVLSYGLRWHRKYLLTSGASFPAPSSHTERWAEGALAVSLVVLGLAIATFPFGPQLAKGLLEATILDVGQGDSIFLAFPEGRTMLLDGGGVPTFRRQVGVGYERSFDIGEQVVSPYLWSRGLKRLDVVALSHPHEDHLGGLGAVLRNFKVGELWVGQDEDSPAYRALLAEAAALGVPVVHLHRGEVIDSGTVEERVLWPGDVQTVRRNANETSLVLKLEDKSVAFLLPGDLEHAAEQQLVASGDPLRADVLKVAHHGSRTSSTEEFLDAVSPRIEIISVGEDNPYGQPNADVLARLAGRGARLLRTDRDGAVTVTTDGRELHVSSFVAAGR